MDNTEIFVVTGGIALIALVIWYFFGEREAVAARTTERGAQQVKITIRGGYSPDVVVVRRGLPVRLDFYRDETSSCSDRVIFDDFNISRSLPAHQTTSIEFTPDREGEFTFTCGMSMMRGKLIVKEQG